MCDVCDVLCSETHSDSKKNVARDKGVEKLKEQVVSERRAIDSLLFILPTLDTLRQFRASHEKTKSTKVLSNFLTARPDLNKLKKMGVLGGDAKGGGLSKKN